MPQPALRVDGAAKLRRTLKQAGLGVQDLKDAHKQIADHVADRARPDAPRSRRGSNRGPAGNLAGSLKGYGTQSESRVQAGTARKVPYGNAVHWGQKKRGNRTGDPWLITPNPWLHATALDEQDPVERLMLTALEKIIRTVEGTTTP